jgi:endonuclease YncB( thermonuclease family)
MILQANGSMRMLRTLYLSVLLLCIPALAQAADVTGVPKIRDGDQVTIGSTRIRLAGIDAPNLDQLCLNAASERWTCGVAARDALAAYVDTKSWTCHVQRTDRFGRSVAKCEVDGEDIGQWLVKNGWALSYVRFSHVYDGDEKAAREANKKTTILGSIKTTDDSLPILLASASGPVAPSPTCRIKGNVNRAGVCIYHTPESRWYAKIDMRISKGTRWFCSKEEAEAAGCRETRR